LWGKERKGGNPSEKKKPSPKKEEALETSE
jgi:hypothetical protein